MQSTHLPRKAFLRGLLAWAGALAAGQLFMRGNGPAGLSTTASTVASLTPKAQTRAVPYKHWSA
ncbi:MAG TPA: hypothetical protein PLV25_02750 [Opitutales bacterium]|nr:hypothetical protein [Opitutales bacterium]